LRLMGKSLYCGQMKVFIFLRWHSIEFPI